MEVRTLLGPEDWLAIGFSDYGELYNADFCVLWRDWRQRTRFSDVFTNKVEYLIILEYLMLRLNN